MALKNLFVLIGSAKDYVNLLATKDKTFHWACPKTARPGDAALIYFRAPFSGIRVNATVLCIPFKGTRWPYEARLGKWSFLDKPVPLDDLRQQILKWPWLRFNRKATSPREPRVLRYLWRIYEGKTRKASSMVPGSLIGDLDRKATVSVRREQAYLRRRLFGGKDNDRCAICHNLFPVNLLVAAHIKHRARCSEKEKRDYKNNAEEQCDRCHKR